MVWMVFPKPISSARMPFKLLLYRDTSHSRPLICRWDRCNKFGTCHLSNLTSSLRTFTVLLLCMCVPGTVWAVRWLAGSTVCPPSPWRREPRRSKTAGRERTLRYRIHHQHPAWHACVREGSYLHTPLRQNRITKGPWDGSEIIPSICSFKPVTYSMMWRASTSDTSSLSGSGIIFFSSVRAWEDWGSSSSSFREENKMVH